MRRRALVALVAGLALFATGVLAVRLDWPLDDTVAGILSGAGASAVFVALLMWWSPEACDAGMPALRSRYLREFVPAMVGYVVALALSLWLLKSIDGGLLRAVVALLPVPPIALALRAMIRYIRDSDELQRRIELEAVSFATAGVSLVYMGGGFLQLAKVVDVPSGVAMIWVFPLVCLLYGIAKAVVSRRYS
jgi:hypothetical protein